VGGLERIGDAEQVAAVLVRKVPLANLGPFTVDELAATGHRRGRSVRVFFLAVRVPRSDSASAANIIE
jgi:hypothetical protein